MHTTINSKNLRLKYLNKKPNFKFHQIDLSNENTLNKESHIFENCDRCCSFRR